MNKISAVIITKNEESNIGICLDSLQWVDEIVLLDTGSTDDTLEIASKFTDKIFRLDDWSGFGEAKQKAVNLASNDWILSIDADEVVSDGLKHRLIQILDNPKYDIYSIKRKSYYLGRLINHSGWSKDYPKRLFNRTKAHFNNKSVHESVIGSSDIGRIEEEIFHYTYPTIASHLEKINFYTDLSSTKQKRISIIGSLLRSIFKFKKMYFFRLGFLDGKEGFILAVISSFGNAIKYFKIWEKSKF